MLPFLAVAVLALAAEVEVPPNDGWVTDLADLLAPPEETALEAQMESYRTGTGHEIALLTVPDLGGESVERFALEVGRAWGIGREGKQDGALLLVARDERQLRIEVGRGLEGDLPDAICGRILRDVITPRFRAGDYAGGLDEGIRAIHAAIGGDYGPLRRSSGGQSAQGALGGCFSVVLLLVVLSLLFRRRRRGAGAGGILPWLLLASMAHGSRSGGGRLGGGGWGGGGFRGFGGGGGFSGGGASGGW
ncbi:MAG: TPM domain-containing protein [Planctomycetota bacterium]